METEVIDKLFLELSQVTKATTRRELDLQAKIEAMSLPDEVVDLRLLMDCRTELRNERHERRHEREDAEVEIETLREILSIREGQLEHCRKDAERMQKEIEMLRDALQSIASHQRSAAAVLRIADAALRGDEVE
jgi:chromosome segregation ATPase